MDRRKFLALTGAAMTGLWLAGAGLIQLSRRMVIAFSGRCSFCGKTAETVFALAGVIGRPERVCNECIEICLEILTDDLLAESERLPPPPVFGTSGIAPAREEFEITEVLKRSAEPQTGVELAAMLEQVRRLLSESATERPRVRQHDELTCSFCDLRQSETSKLIAGPSTYICDVCVGDAAALISMHA